MQLELHRQHAACPAQLSVNAFSCCRVTLAAHMPVRGPAFTLGAELYVAGTALHGTSSRWAVRGSCWMLSSAVGQH